MTVTKKALNVCPSNLKVTTSISITLWLHCCLDIHGVAYAYDMPGDVCCHSIYVEHEGQCTCCATTYKGPESANRPTIVPTLSPACHLVVLLLLQL